MLNRAAASLVVRRRCFQRGCLTRDLDVIRHDEE